MKYAVAVIGAILAIAAGFFIGRSQRAVVVEQKQEQISIYYLKNDGLYQIRSDKEGEELLLTGQFKDLQLANDRLVVASESAFMIYDLNGKQTTTTETITEITGLRSMTAISPDGTKVAYVKNVLINDTDSFKNELWLLDLTTGQKQKLLEESGYYILTLNRWLDNQRILVGRAYEGASYCIFTIGVDTKLPENCVGFGEEGIGRLDRILAAENGVAYGVKRVWPEFGNSRDQTGLYQQPTVDQKQFINDDIASSLVKNGDVLYLTKLLDDTQYQAVGADVFSFNLKDESSQRLTHDATSVDTKENLRISNDGRYLTFDSKEISTNKTKAWLYDLKLNKYYPLGDNTFSAVVVEQ